MAKVVKYFELSKKKLLLGYFLLGGIAPSTEPVAGEWLGGIIAKQTIGLADGLVNR